MSLGTNGRHRRRGLLRRAGPAAATTAGSVALVTTIGTAAFWLVPGQQHLPFGGFGPGSTGAARPTSEKISPTGTAATSKPGDSSESTAGQPIPPVGSAAVAAARASQVAASRGASRTPATSSTPRPSKSKTKGRPSDKPSLPITTPPPLVSTTTPPFLPVSITATVSEPDLP